MHLSKMVDCKVTAFKNWQNIYVFFQDVFWWSFQRLLVDCKVMGFKNWQNIYVFSRILPDGLVIEGLQPEDNGVYVCTAENPSGFDEKIFTVNIECEF